ncbi:MAG: response regulator receiver and domain protein [Streptosporangiaceae bacterium]|nr:response regulator receiver and domain protein [Streptosporangiaceae bacterium]
MVREQRLAQVFVELADTLVEEFDVVDLLQTLTERCVELVDTDAAGLMLDDQRGNLRLIAHTTSPRDCSNCSSCSSRRDRAWTASPAARSSPTSTSPPPRTAGRSSPGPPATSDSAPPTRCPCGCGGR